VTSHSVINSYVDQLHAMLKWQSSNVNCRNVAKLIMICDCFIRFNSFSWVLWYQILENFQFFTLDNESLQLHPGLTSLGY